MTSCSLDNKKQFIKIFLFSQLLQGQRSEVIMTVDLPPGRDKVKGKGIKVGAGGDLPLLCSCLAADRFRPLSFFSRFPPVLLSGKARDERE
jgi:hypothetical protein